MENENALLSPRQKQVMYELKRGGMRRINIFEGSIRSGKTYVSFLAFGFWAAQCPREKAFLMAGKTLQTLKRNVLEPMKNIFGGSFEYNIYKKEAELFGRKIYLESAANSESEGKLRGMTLMGAYCDELTLFSEDFFTMLLSRLSEEGAKLFATTNPDDPSHWLKRDYLDNGKIDLKRFVFRLEDNIFLPEDYVNQLRDEFSGVFYERFILGKWTKAQGRVYDCFSEKNIISCEELSERLKKKPIVHSAVGVDFGGNGSASAFAHVGFDAGFENVYILAEYYDKENISAERLVEDFVKFIEREKASFPTLSRAYCDSAEQLLIKSLRKAVRIEVLNARKSVIASRISLVSRLIASGRFFVCERCVNTIKALEDAVWDIKFGAKTERLDDGTTNIDSLDALEYAVERYAERLVK